MDPRITEKINKIKQDEINKKEKQIQIEEERVKWYKSFVKEKIPEARIFVEKYFLDYIAKLETQGKKEINLSDLPNYDCPWSKGNISPPPLESLIVALSEIDGLSISKKYVPEIEGHIYSDETWDIIPAHYEYGVIWK